MLDTFKPFVHMHLHVCMCVNESRQAGLYMLSSLTSHWLGYIYNCNYTVCKNICCAYL
jgi:hypothetical protein